MTKLSDSRGSHCWFPEWLKELARWVEVVDPHNFEENRYIYRELVRIAKAILKIEADEHHPCDEPVYEPQTYDEAIALCKGWPRAAFGYDISWEKDKWPELWKEMVKAKIRRLYLSEISENVWIFNLSSVIYADSTPGRVVCQAYLIYKGYADWAERLSRMEGER